MNVRTTRDELVARLKRAGELQVSGENQAETDTYFNMEQFRFRAPDGFETDYAGLANYFKAIRAAFDDRSIRRGIVVAEAKLHCLPDVDRGHFPVRRPGADHRGVGTDGLQTGARVWQAQGLECVEMYSRELAALRSGNRAKFDRFAVRRMAARIGPGLFALDERGAIDQSLRLHEAT